MRQLSKFLSNEKKTKKKKIIENSITKLVAENKKWRKQKKNIQLTSEKKNCWLFKIYVLMFVP